MAAQEPYPVKSNSWLILLRLLIFIVIGGIVTAWLGFPDYLRGPFLGYSFITLASLIMLALRRRLRFPLVASFLTTLTFIAEVGVEAGIVYSTGTLYSPFAVLFLLTIITAALVYRLVGTLLVASLASISYVAVTWINAALSVPGGEMFSSRPGSLFSADDMLFYSAFLHILVFYLVAFIAGYLAGRLRIKDRELDSASAALKRARLETDDILRHLNSGLISITLEGDIVFFNRAAENILELAEADVSGKNCRDIFTGRLAAFGSLLLSGLSEEYQLARREFQIESINGRSIPIGISSSILFDEQGERRGVISIFQDISDAKQMEERIRQADRMAAVGELSAYIAHEIRNPLASISGSVEVLQADLELEGDNEKLMSLILKETSRLNKILSDFLIYARVGRPRLQKIEANRIISDIIELVRRHPAYRDSIKFEILSGNHLTFMSGDEDQVKQLMLNLVVNACDAMAETGGVIQFDIKTMDNQITAREVCLIVRDNGPGIPADTIQKIFLPFYSTKQTGTGLGLALVSRLMEAHNGRVEVSSTPGEGAEFRLYFHGMGEDAALPDTAVEDVESIGA